MNSHPRIHSIADLDRERAVLREKIIHQEEILRDHYTTLTEPLNPVMRVANFISGNRLFKGIQKEGDGIFSDGIGILLKLLLAGTAGGFILKRSKKNLFRTLLAYAIDQGVNYVKDKDISEHFEKIKQWLKKKGKDADEEDEEEETIDGKDAD